MRVCRGSLSLLGKNLDLKRHNIYWANVIYLIHKVKVLWLNIVVLRHYYNNVLDIQYIEIILPKVEPLVALMVKNITIGTIKNEKYK